VACNLERIAEGYVPDLVVVGAEVDEAADRANARFLVPEQVSLAVEVTSPWTAHQDREPNAMRERGSKWNGYAFTGVPFYLVIDCDPARLAATLHSVPDVNGGAYLESRRWEFGAEISLPEPFDVVIPTTSWAAWAEG